MFDTTTFGSATWDIFIRDKEISFDKKTNKVFFPLGSKIGIDEIHFSSGGGGTNSAATFLYQGLKTAYCGIVGNDPAGESIILEMKKRGADTSFIYKSDKKNTNHSFVLSIPNQDRTILVYRGASDTFDIKNIKNLKSKWFYLTSLPKAKSFENIVNFAFLNNIKIAVNPGNYELKLPSIRNILQKTDILLLNEEESSILTGVSGPKRIIGEIARFYPGIFVMTRGSRGVVVFDGKYIYEAGILKSRVVDKTGAGDSFGAGFVSGILKNKNIAEAIQLASGNATGCLSKWGAKNGLLEKNDKFRKVKVVKKTL